MNKLFLFFLLLFSLSYCYSQQLSQVSFSQATDFNSFTLSTYQNVLVRISAEGKLLEYGTEEASLYNRNYYAPKLLPYNGAIGYFKQDPDTILNGKIKNIGMCYFTYYGSKDYPERIGKIKSAGNLLFDYYRNYEDALNFGKLKTVGSNTITYFGAFENEVYKGKLKAVGNTAITYYSSFDNPSLKGKLKSIGSYHFDWIPTSTTQGFIYYLKTGNQRQLINGITYIPQ